MQLAVIIIVWDEKPPSYEIFCSFIQSFSPCIVESSDIPFLKHLQDSFERPPVVVAW